MYSFDHFLKDLIHWHHKFNLKSRFPLQILLTISMYLTLSSLASVWIISILLSRHFPGFWQGEFVQQSRASLVGDHILYSRDLSVWFKGDVVRRNKMLVTLSGWRVKVDHIILQTNYLSYISQNSQQNRVFVNHMLEVCKTVSFNSCSLQLNSITTTIRQERQLPLIVKTQKFTFTH